MSSQPAVPVNFKEIVEKILSKDLEDDVVQFIWSQYFTIHRLINPYEFDENSVLCVIQYLRQVNDMIVSCILDKNYFEKMKKNLDKI